MKKPNIILLFLMVLTCWVGCHKDKEIDVKEAVVLNEERTVSETQARLTWQVDFAGQFQTGVEVSQNENMTALRRVEAAKQDDKYMAVVDSLMEGTKYYYRIVVWNKFGDIQFTNGDFTTLEAAHDTVYYTVSVSCLPEEGRVSGGGRFEDGDICTVTATANAGYSFLHWTEDDCPVSEDSIYAFVVTRNRTLMADFSEVGAVLYTVTTVAEPTEGGEVTGGGTYEEGTEIELKATENPGYTFSHWNDGSTDNPRTVPVTADVTYTAYFTQNEYTITVTWQPENGGTATGGGTFHYGETATLTATPADGYDFAGWSDGSNENPHAVTVTGNATYTATFNPVGTTFYTVSVSPEPEEGGTVTGGGAYEEGTEVQLRATANAGYRFDHWNDGSTRNPRTITVTADTTYTAYFTQNEYTIAVTWQPENGGTATGGGRFHYGETATLMATPVDCYEFTGWSDGNTENPRTVTVTGDVTYTANFSLINYLITVTVSGSGGTAHVGSASGPTSQNFDCGTECTIYATANSGYIFDHWQDGNTENPRIITVTANATYTAYFTVQPQAPTGAINGKFTINASGDKVYFSQGNLKYSNGTWSFHEHQYDCCFTTNGDVSSYYTANGTFDLFGWGTSGWFGSGTYYRPWDTDNSDGTLYGPTGTHNLTGSYAHADWGVHNAISNGGGQAGLWRTLSKDEWAYVFQGRSGASSKYGHGKVDGVRGMILLPDEWMLPSDLNFTSGNSNWVNVYTIEQWTLMEQNGAVFLPAAGHRNGTTVTYVGSYGYYWSASYYGNESAHYVEFTYNSHTNYAGHRDGGFSVRLVRSAQ